MPTPFTFGAHPEAHGVRFHVWAATPHLALVIPGHPHSPFTHFTVHPKGLRELFVEGIGPGARYGYLLDGQGPFPDPASRFQPDGVHGLSEVVDPSYPWIDAHFTPVPWPQTVFYELHLGTFTPEGTYAAAAAQLPLLRDLGITAVELMPLADCPGRWNWGYDGVSLYAPNHNYGRPDDLRYFVDQAHRLGLSVYLDAVYNHLGPDGAYHGLFHPRFYASDVDTPWGIGPNFHGPDRAHARAFFLENGLYWLRDFHIDGFRLDATHAIEDRSERHFLKEFTHAVHAEAQALGRTCAVIAEDGRNLASLLVDEQHGGYGFDGVWSDDFHHQLRRSLAGDHAGYFAPFTGSIADIAQTLRQGWYYVGQSVHPGGPLRGTPTADLPRDRFIICLQNHDQVGNRAHGERLHHQIDAASYRAATALLLLAAETPLLFMGQEWAATSPFLYFTDHHPALGRAVTQGRLREFSAFPEFADPDAQSKIPDPQAESTFFRSKLDWVERTSPHHLPVWRWYQRLLTLRQDLLQQQRTPSVDARDGLLTLSWRGLDDTIVALIALQAQASSSQVPAHGELLLSSESPDYATASEPPSNGHFTRPGCLVYRLTST